MGAFSAETVQENDVSHLQEKYFLLHRHTKNCVLSE